MTDINKIKPLFNPVRIMKSDDWIEIVQVVDPHDAPHITCHQWATLFALQQRYESLTSRKLEKEKVKEWISGPYEFNYGERTELYLRDVGLFVCGEDTFSDLIFQTNRRNYKGLNFTESFVEGIINEK